MVKVNVKWGKQLFKDVELDPMESVTTFKAQLMALTNVPTDRQKLMAKGLWKGILKEDASFKAMDKLKDGSQIMLMGSAEVVKQPDTKTLFVEDMTNKEKAQTGAVVPAGFTNLGNTCYMNSTLQCLRYIPELRETLRQHEGGINADLAQSLTATLRDAFRDLDASAESYPPIAFVDTLRRAFPQFAQQGPRGGYMQQDSDEFLQSLFSTISTKLTKPVGIPSLGPAGNMIDALMGLDMEETLKCTESEEEKVIVKHEKALKIVCNINKDVNHLSEGVQVGLEGTIEKNSDLLGRNAVWKKTLRINRLPKYICVQFMRFYWKLTPESRDHTGVKCKMLRPISFPTTLDTFEFCSDELKSVLKVSRDKNSDKILNEFKDKGEEEKKEDAMELDEEDRKALEDAKNLSMNKPNREAGIGLPDEFMGMYELFAVVTHKGRSADSGHYIGWAREKGDDWLCFDDDDVSPCKTEDIQKLKGGGDWHMSYLAFYRAKE